MPEEQQQQVTIGPVSGSLDIDMTKGENLPLPVVPTREQVIAAGYAAGAAEGIIASAQRYFNECLAADEVMAAVVGKSPEEVSALMLVYANSVGVPIEEAENHLNTLMLNRMAAAGEALKQQDEQREPAPPVAPLNLRRNSRMNGASTSTREPVLHFDCPACHAPHTIPAECTSATCGCGCVIALR
jgi:hypothetical protein